jgi:hypothetical protein
VYGTGIAWLAFEQAQKGLLTGDNPGNGPDGNPLPKNSVQINGAWVPTRIFLPLSESLGQAAALSETLRTNPTANIGELATKTAQNYVAHIVDAEWLRSIADIVNAWRGTESKVASVGASYAKSLVPDYNLLKQAGNLYDAPRAAPATGNLVQDIQDKVAAGLPGLRGGYPTQAELDAQRQAPAPRQSSASSSSSSASISSPSSSLRGLGGGLNGTRGAAGSGAPAPSGAPPPIASGSIASGSISKGDPDPSVTPGSTLPNVTEATVSRTGYARDTRNVPQSVKDEVYRAYGIAQHQRGDYEIDHLIPLALGGSNDPSNLWPQPKDDPGLLGGALFGIGKQQGFQTKDLAEVYLHDQVAAGKMSLRDAQQAIVNDWRGVAERIPKAERDRLIRGLSLTGSDETGAPPPIRSQGAPQPIGAR